MIQYCRQMKYNLFPKAASFYPAFQWGFLSDAVFWWNHSMQTSQTSNATMCSTVCSLNRSIMQFPFLNFYHLSMSAMHASGNEYLSEVNVLIALTSCIKQRKINPPIHLIFFNWYILDGTFRPSIRWNNFENRPIIMVSGLLPWLRQLARS